ncbi:aminoglycoside phosphotransferase family protein [Jiangella ureilytica]|uniref:Aminoglycoside phosphotransferase family protein n=1 Tax=Jiangella ureilytica TaxID=2530374 RepID=A0A4R4RNV1_9ACTN|nr:phosphotransferase [Jiangella ureilytica]TDC51457.1 aminoglycoside phosphotransferase family protein [Jiangella ureilytica]
MTTIEPWTSAEWLAAATGWLDEQLAAAGRTRTGPVTQPHVRLWATALRAPTDAGPVWLKAPGSETAFEVPLYGLLAQAAPRWVLVPLAADVERGWLLLPDGGTPLGEQVCADDLPGALAEAIPHYAELQRDLSGNVAELLSFGLADMRPPALPERLDQALEAVGAYLGHHATDDDREVLRRAAAARPLVEDWCDRLASGAVPASLDHHDLHAWNVLVTPGGTPRFYDWGDSVVAHPFTSMLVTLGFLRLQHHRPDDDPGVRRVRDAYLEAFGDLGSRDELVAELDLACRAGKVARVLVWLRGLRPQGFENAEPFQRAPVQALAAILAESPFDLGA